MSRPWARFDDLQRGEAVRCPPPHRVLVARTVGEVADVLVEVDEATAHGSWAFGYISYEAAPGLDASLPGGPTPGQPALVWFGLCDEPPRVEPVSTPGIPGFEAGTWQAGPWRPDWTEAEHAVAVARVREHIAAWAACTLTSSSRWSATPRSGS